MPITYPLRRALLTRPAFTTRPAVIYARPVSQTPHLRARKGAEGKDDMVIEPNEISKSGSDTQANSVSDAAFSKDKTRPEEQMASAEKESGEQGINNPLDVSPANHEVSHTKDAQEGGAEASPSQQGFGDRKRTSGGSGADSSKKSGTGKKFE